MKFIFKEKLGLRRFYILALFSIICSSFSSYACDLDRDPCFFRLITNDKRKIYVLGTIHVSPIEETLSVPACEELKRIAREENPILYVEHELNNKDALKILEQRGGEVKTKINWKNSVIKKEYIPLLNDKIFISPNHPSNITVEQLLDIDPWLAAPILSCHTNCSFYPLFGGTEYNLENSAEWKKSWSEVACLEDSEHYKILEKCANTDRQHNVEWINKTLYRLMLLKSILKEPTSSDDELEMLVIKAEKENATVEIQKLLKEMKMRHVNRGWEVVNFSDLHLIPSSVLLRNESWPKPIVIKLSSMSIDKESNSFLIICGDGHLSGITKDKSFLSYLMQTIQPISVERFANSSKSWKNVS